MNNYVTDGFLLIEDFLSRDELEKITPIIERFHESWKKENHKFYNEKAVNSAYLTDKKHLDEDDRNILFKFISSSKLIERVSSMPFQLPAFMNTQLFFNPVNIEQKNYWHRDPQYHLTIEEQKKILSGPEVIHFRIALRDEKGVELIPGTHKRWDSEEEQNIRLEINNRKSHEDISTGHPVHLKKGDLLIFSANMIHRGLYGKDRLALDILFCEALPELMQFVNDDCLPACSLMQHFENSTPIANTIKIKSKVSATAT